MLLTPDCITCTTNLAIKALRETTSNEDLIKNYLKEILRIPALQGENWKITSPEVLEKITQIITELTNNYDPFLSHKTEQNNKVLELYPKLKDKIEKDNNPLFLASNLAIIGNAIDEMVLKEQTDMEQLILERLKIPIHRKSFLIFEKKLESSKNIIYLGDNCGEIVFDKLLLETIKELYNINITFVVRSLPALNDATYKDALELGIDNLATLIENGIDGPLPGTILKRSSSDLKLRIKNSDLIISKGGGNYDSFSEERGLNKDVFFLLIAKCRPYCRIFDTSMDMPIIANYKL